MSGHMNVFRWNTGMKSTQQSVSNNTFRDIYIYIYIIM